VTDVRFSRKSFWTAGRDFASKPGEFKWSTTKLNTLLSGSLEWKRDKAKEPNSCVFLDMNIAQGQFENPKLATDGCSQKKYFLCEVSFYFIAFLQIDISTWLIVPVSVKKPFEIN